MDILAAAGHLLVTGGPGSGKTTIALLKAQKRIPNLKPGQEILFLSFSRAAVRQVLTRCKAILSSDERRLWVGQEELCRRGNSSVGLQKAVR